MKSGIVMLFVFGALVDVRSLAQFRGTRGEDREAGRHGWIFSLEEGKAQARKNGRPLMVVIRCVP